MRLVRALDVELTQPRPVRMRPVTEILQGALRKNVRAHPFPEAVQLIFERLG